MYKRQSRDLDPTDKPIPSPSPYPSPFPDESWTHDNIKKLNEFVSKLALKFNMDNKQASCVFSAILKYNYEKICSNVRWVSPVSCRSCKFVSTS